jgi:hypothetical protein
VFSDRCDSLRYRMHVLTTLRPALLHSAMQRTLLRAIQSYTSKRTQYSAVPVVVVQAACSLI